MRFHDRRHRADPEPPDKKSALVEIEAALMQGHRVERSALHHDELRVLIIEPAQGPAHLILVVAVDDDELLAHGHEIERIHPLAVADEHLTSDDRRLGTECVRACTFRRSPFSYNKNNK